jgi:hypothetical protein
MWRKATANMTPTLYSYRLDYTSDEVMMSDDVMTLDSPSDKVMMLD